MNNKSKNILIIILSVLLICSIGIIGYLVYNKNNTLLEISGKVVGVGNNYFIINSKGEEFIFSNISGEYDLGDELTVKFKEKKMNKNSEPKSIMLDSDDVVEVLNEAEKIENKELEHESVENKEEVGSGEINNSSAKPSGESPSQNKNDKPSSNNENNDLQGESADTVVLKYFNNLEADFKSSQVKDSIKNGFVTVVDFLFYDGSIKGHTFSELTETAKLKVLSMALYFDSKIEKYFPGYKESISSTTSKIYTNVKTSIVKTYLNLSTKICSENKELCEVAKNDFNSMKKSFGLTWSLIKEIAGDGVSSLKEWYEIYSGKN